MLKVYFDNVLIDTESYTQLDNEYNLFSENFKLGSVACNTFKLSVLKSAVVDHPNKVKIEDDDTELHFIVDNIIENDDVYVYTLVDKLMDFNFEYDASPLIQSKAELEEECYLSDIWHDMCNQANVEYDEDYIFENDIVVNWYDSRIQARRYLSFIAELQSGYACMLENGKQSFKKQNRSSVKTIDADECSDLIVGEKKKITRVVYDGGVFKWEFGDETGDTLYLQSDNVYITSEQIVENIYNNIKDFEFYIIDVPNAPMDSSVRAGDIITFDDNGKLYPTIAQYSMSYAGGWTGGYKLKVNTNRQQETQITRTANNVRNLQTKVDRLNNEFSVIAEEIEKLTDYIRNVGTTGNYIKLPDTPKSSGAINKLSIKGFSLIPKYKGMQYKSKTSYKGVLNFYTLIFSDEQITYSSILPEASEELLGNIYNEGGLKGKYWRCILNENNYEWQEINDLSNIQEIYINSPIPLQSIDSVYDEMLFENNKLNIIQRIGYDFDNEQYEVLSQPIEYDLGVFALPTYNDYTYITMKYWTNLTYNCEYIEDNEFTRSYTTQIESKSQLNMTSKNIELKVNKDNIISSINLSPEEAKIESSKLAKIKAPQIELEGLTTINNNFKVLLDGSIEAVNGRFSGDVIVGNTELVDKELGLLTTFIFPIKGEYSNQIGWSTYSGDGSHKLQASGGVIIPDNFELVSAKLFLKGYKTEWFDSSSSVGYAVANNVKLKKDPTNHFKQVMWSGVWFNDYSTTNTNALGTNGVTVGGINGTEHIVDIDKSYFNKGFNRFIIEADMSQPSTEQGRFLTQVIIEAGIQITGYAK